MRTEQEIRDMIAVHEKELRSTQDKIAESMRAATNAMLSGLRMTDFRDVNSLVGSADCRQIAIEWLKYALGE